MVTSWTRHIWHQVPQATRLPQEARGVVQHFSSDDGAHYLRFADAGRINAEQVFREHREIGEHPAPQGPLVLFLTDRVGGTEGVRTDRFGDSEPLFRTRTRPEAVRRLTMSWMETSGFPSETGESVDPGRTIPAFSSDFMR